MKLPGIGVENFSTLQFDNIKNIMIIMFITERKGRKTLAFLREVGNGTEGRSTIKIPAV